MVDIDGNRLATAISGKRLQAAQRVSFSQMNLKPRNAKRAAPTPRNDDAEAFATVRPPRPSAKPQ